MAVAGCVVEVHYLYPRCSQYYTEQYCPKQFALNLPVAKVTADPKVQKYWRCVKIILRVHRNNYFA